RSSCHSLQATLIPPAGVGPGGAHSAWQKWAFPSALTGALRRLCRTITRITLGTAAPSAGSPSIHQDQPPNVPAGLLESAWAEASAGRSAAGAGGGAAGEGAGKPAPGVAGAGAGATAGGAWPDPLMSMSRRIRFAPRTART